ncbi:DNA methylase [Lentzea sp. JNUCC 0626]|uniref:DNA methylase n=1 Tax=Lentzea sp. JNUCC 0626 TaxID=3367513 RepID=UPI003748BF5C
MARPLLLDAFCRKGGSSAGYEAAGFHVVGVDIEDHADGYAGSEFVQADAVTYIRDHGHQFAAIHAGPPCQRDCALTLGTNAARAGLHTSLLEVTREALDATGRPYVIEQPIGRAPMRRDVLLCGLMYDLKVYRHRQFELSGWTMPNPAHPSHRGHRVAGYRHGRNYEGDMYAVYGDGGGKGSVTDWQRAMGIPWMSNKKDLAEAIPPAYTRHLGEALHALVANPRRSAAPGVRVVARTGLSRSR